MRFLFVCSGNISRSPTAEAVLRRMTDGAHEARSAGISPTAVRPISGEDLAWADLVAVMEDEHRAFVLAHWPEAGPKIRVLDIEDRYPRDDPALVRVLEAKLGDLLAEAGAGPPGA